MPKPTRHVSLSLAATLFGCSYNLNGPTCGPALSLSTLFSNHTTAQWPRVIGGSEGYQDHRGGGVPVTSAPPLNDTGSESIPTFNGRSARVQTLPDFVIMPEWR